MLGLFGAAISHWHLLNQSNLKYSRGFEACLGDTQFQAKKDPTYPAKAALQEIDQLKRIVK